MSAMIGESGTPVEVVPAAAVVAAAAVVVAGIGVVVEPGVIPICVVDVIQRARLVYGRRLLSLGLRSPSAT